MKKMLDVEMYHFALDDGLHSLKDIVDSWLKDDYLTWVYSDR